MKKLLLIIAVIMPSLCAAQWTPVLQDFNGGITKVFAIDKDHACVIGCGGSYWRTNNGGDSWTQYSTGTDVCLFDVVFLDPDHGYICGEQGTLLKTTDGETWTPLTTNTICNLRSLSFKDPQTGYVSGLYGVFFPNGDSGVILKTTDGGNSFITKKYPAGVISVSMKNADTCFATANRHASNQIIRTTDGGNEWEIIKETDESEFISVVSFDDGTLYAFVRFGFTMFRSTDNGTTWNSVPLDDFQIINHVSFPVKSYGFTSGFDPMPQYGRLYKTCDGGDTWQTEFSSIYLDDVSVVITPGHDTIGYASQSNGYLYKLEIITGVNDKDQNSLKIFPSPFEDNLTVQFTGAKSISAVLYSADMKQVLSLSCNSEKLFIDDLKKLPAGVYFIKVTVAGNSYVRKVVHGLSI